MNPSSLLPSTRPIVYPPSPDWSRSRSQTEPITIDTLLAQPFRADASASRPLLKGDHSKPTRSPSRRKQSLDSASAKPLAATKDAAAAPSSSISPVPPRLDQQAGTSALPNPGPDSFPATPVFTAPSSASTSDSRSPFQRRAPASHSSYGVGTSDGPPPSFSTQRTLSQDRLWKPCIPDKANLGQKPYPGPLYDEPESQRTMIDLEQEQEQEQEQEADQAARSDLGRDELDRSSTPRKRLQEPADTQDVQNAGGVKETHSTESFYTSAEEFTQPLDLPSPDEASRNSGSEGRKSEDVFLNIAQTEAGDAGGITRSERRTSKIEPLHHSADAPQNEAAPSPADRRGGEITFSARKEVLHLPNKRRSMGSRSVAASAHPAEDSGRHRPFSNGSKARTKRAHSVVGKVDRRPSPESVSSSEDTAMRNDSGQRSSRPSNLPASATDRALTCSHPPEQSRRQIDHAPAPVDGTESSTMSTTAPSTVWDELEELKSRIRKLEATGKLPSSSAAAMSSAERPRTATTTVTTMSSSPKNDPHSTPAKDSALDGVPATVHPLLHEALRKSRPLVSSEIYQKLEATASDALQLASAMGAGTQTGSSPTYEVLSSTERQLRRKADSMCRGLTELALALAAPPPSPANEQSCRPDSGDPSSADYGAGLTSRLGRRSSLGAHESHLALMPRVPTRLESRRSSLLPSSMHPAPQENTTTEIAIRTPSSVPSFHQMQSGSSSRQDRAVSRLRSRRTLGVMEGADDSDKDDGPSLRPVSRARTEVGLRSRRARDRTSLGREYTSSYPLPNSGRRGDDHDDHDDHDDPDDDSSQYSPSVLASSGIRSRRHQASLSGRDGSSGLYSPATPRDAIQPGYRRYVSGGMARDASTYVSSSDHTPERGPLSAGSRRSLATPSRLGQMGSFVNGRLRAAKADRERHEALQAQAQASDQGPAVHVTRPPASDDSQEKETAES